MYNKKESTMSILARLNDLSVGKKLGFSFALLVLLTAVVAVEAIITLSTYNERSLIIASAGNAQSSLLDARTDEKNFQLRRDDTYRRNAEALVDQAVNALLPLKDILVIPEDRARVDFVADSSTQRSEEHTSELQSRPHLV